MMQKSDKVATIAELEALYGTPGAPALRKVATQLTPLYRRWIMQSRFCVLTTVPSRTRNANKSSLPYIQ